MSSNKINVCLIQLAVVPYNFEENKNKIKKYIDKVMALPQKPDIIVLPEMWNIGFTIHNVDHYCDKDGAQTQQFLSDIAKHHHVVIIGGSVANYNSKEKIYQNLNINVDAEGKGLSTYAKVHLFSPSKEDTVFTRGHQYKVTSTTFPNNNNINNNDNVNDGNNDTQSSSSSLECIFSSVICYDIRFPEFIRSIALSGLNLKKELIEKQQQQQLLTNSEKVQGGLDILFVSAAWPYPRLKHWKHLLIARAIENQCFVVAVNNCGEMDGLTFCGHSLVIDPWGEVLIEGHGPLDESLSVVSDQENSSNYNEIIEIKDEGEQPQQQIGQHHAFDEILMTTLSFDILKDIRQRICVFNDRFPEVYHCN